MSDIGWTHVALYARDIDASVDFYSRFARMSIVHRYTDGEGRRIAWLSDRSRPFALVLIETKLKVERRSAPRAHLGVALPSRELIDERSAIAKSEKRLRGGPTDSGAPLGYWALIADPDGHLLEISHGQEIGRKLGAS